MVVFHDLENAEDRLTGQWTLVNGRPVADEVTARILFLIENRLVRRSVADGGWSVLYEDPRDGRFWELRYPESELHGGGPPELCALAREVVEARYGVRS
jgi:hypothetical protein